ncbi:fibronectin type III domain-containing protein [Kitasatospora sp. NPDC056076]|uniref:fibronectin type III domain-containing protein n=1 Tax=Kitasatospora sp. NPDC056076 TaxID=3345703 RepID=UPI0035DAD780
MADPIPVPVLSGTATDWNSVTLDWTYDGPDATFTISRYSSVTNTTVTAASGLASATRTYTETDLPEIREAVLKYRIKAVAGGAESDWSNEVTVVTPQRQLPLPTGLRATATTSTTVSLAWTYVSDARIGRVMIQVEKTGDNGEKYWDDVQGSYFPEQFQAFTVTGLQPATTYRYRLQVRTRGGEVIREATVPVEATTKATVPAQVTNLTATNVTYTSARLVWEYTAGDVAAAKFNIYRATDPIAGYTLEASLQGDKRLYNDVLLVPSTLYHYRVTSVAADGSESNPVEVALTTGTLYTPAIVVQSTTSSTAVIGWHAVPDAEGYELQRRLPNDAAWKDVGPQIPGTDTSYTDSGLTEMTEYRYRMRVVAGAYFSDWSEEVAAITTSALKAPALTATARSATEVFLEWTGDAAPDSFMIEKSTDQGSSWAPLATVPGATTRYTDDQGNAPGNRRWYRVREHRGTENSPWSNVADVTLWYGVPAPDASITQPTGNSAKITWTWPDPDSRYPVLSWIVERRTGTGAWGVVGNPDNPPFEQTGLDAGVTYTYRVTAVLAGGVRSPASQELTITTRSSIVAPVLTAVPQASTSIKVSWTGEPTGATSLELQRSADGGKTWVTIGGAMVKPKSSPYFDNNLTPATTYQYRMRATVGPDTSDWSNIATATTAKGRPTPVLTVTAVNGSTARLAWTWDDPEGRYPIQYFVAEERQGSDPFVPIGSHGPTVRTADRIGLTPGATYDFRISATLTTGVTVVSNVFTITMPAR